MDNESNGSSTKGRDTLQIWLTAFVFYCLAPGPVVFVYFTLQNTFNFNSSAIETGLVVFFYPHLLIGEQYTVYENYIVWWMELGGGY